ncbi:MAG: DUF3526 domain-containing protein [Alphaproteobacteria bacterium]|nr:DUF3526 domain-containing protein [Alphaproteobacteria bacterium]
MYKIISRKEYAMLIRDRRFHILATIVTILLIVSMWAGFSAYKIIRNETDFISKESRSHWIKQGSKNPHEAAHYGSFVFRPKSELSFLDFGVTSYIGNSIYLEGHNHNEPKFSQAQESSGLIRFGDFTVAFIFYTLLPLFIIFMCFNSFTIEKEEKTLKLMLSQGIGLDVIAWGKIEGFSKCLAWVFLPCLLISFGLVIIGTPGGVSFNTFMRLFLNTIVFGGYFFVFICLSVLVSIWSKSSRNALLILLGVWVMMCIIIPKLSANLGGFIFKAPKNFEFTESIRKEVLEGIDGHHSADVRLNKLKQTILAEYNVDSLSQLPINFDAIVMQEAEKHSSQVYKKYFDSLEKIYQKQNYISDIFSLIDPFITVRNFSMSLAGTDYKTALEFQRQAEQYRYNMVEKLQNHMRDYSKTGDWEIKVNENFFAKIPEFKFKKFSINDTITQNWLSIISLFVWIQLCIRFISNLKNFKMNDL